MTKQHQALFSFDMRLKYDPSMFLTGLVRFTHAITLIETFFLITISSAFSLGTFGVKCSIHAPLSSTSACSAVSRQWPQQTSLAAAPNKEAALWHFLLNHTVHCTVVMVTRGLLCAGVWWPGRREAWQSLWVRCNDVQISTDLRPVERNGRAVSRNMMLDRHAGRLLNWSVPVGFGQLAPHSAWLSEHLLRRVYDA